MKRTLFSLFLLFSLYSQGQLPVYTLYHTNPLPVNPALAGSAHQFRSGLNFRNQWSSYVNPILGYSVFVDNYFSSIRSGIGASVYSDVLGSTNFRSTQIGFFYSQTIKLTDRVFIKAGIQPALGFTGFDGGSLLFNDQLNSRGNTGNATAETLAFGSKKTYLNLNSGILFTVNNFWVGASGYNLLKPQVGLTSSSKLPIGFGIQSGMKIEFRANQISRKENQERYLMPHLFMSSIGTSQQLYTGMEMVYEPFSLGLLLRGNYFSKVNGIENATSAAFNFGFRKKNVHFNYAYDLPISNKSRLLGPSHELSVQTLFKLWQKPTRRTIKRLDLF